MYLTCDVFIEKIIFMIMMLPLNGEINLFIVFYKPVDYIEKNDDIPTDISNAIDYIMKLNRCSNKKRKYKRNSHWSRNGLFLVGITGKLKPVT